jgi:hypothetical protein
MFQTQEVLPNLQHNRSIISGVLILIGFALILTGAVFVQIVGAVMIVIAMLIPILSKPESMSNGFSLPSNATFAAPSPDENARASKQGESLRRDSHGDYEPYPVEPEPIFHADDDSSDSRTYAILKEQMELRREEYGYPWVSQQERSWLTAHDLAPRDVLGPGLIVAADDKLFVSWDELVKGEGVGARETGGTAVTHRRSKLLAKSDTISSARARTDARRAKVKALRKLSEEKSTPPS